MLSNLHHIFFTFLFSLVLSPQPADTSINNPTIEKKATTPLTVNYEISIDAKKNSSIAEMYNGGSKTLFIQNNEARVRMVTLMRIQSIYYNASGNTKSTLATIVKESGKEKYRVALNAEQWLWYNRNYQQVSCTFSEETKNILGYNCKKVIIRRQDGEKIIAYYTEEIKHPLLPQVEPIFGCVPGLVLEYEHQSGKNKIQYKAVEINQNEISDQLFKVPTKGFAIKKFTFLKNSESKIPEVLLEDGDVDENGIPDQEEGDN